MSATRATDRHAEMALIGAAMIDPSVIDLVSLPPSDFFGMDLQGVWEAITAMHAQGIPLDELTIADRTGGDLTLLTKCSLSVPTADNAEHYADIVRRHALTRKVLVACATIQEQHTRGATGEELLNAAHGTLAGIEVGGSDTTLTIGAVVKERMAQLDHIAREQQAGRHMMTGFPTGVAKLDEFLGGVQPGIVTVVAARPAMGKSSLALNIADASSAAGHGVHVFSLEDGRHAFADRVMARASRIPAERFRNLQFSRGELATAMVQIAEVAKRTMWLYDDICGADADAIVRQVRRHARDNGTRVALVDYLQLLPNNARESRNEALGRHMRAFSSAAKKDGVAYVVMSQLNRELEKRKDKRPILSDLRESGDIEQIAKCVIGLYRGCEYGDPVPGVDYDRCDRAPTDEEWRRVIDLLILKNNHGRAGAFLRATIDLPTTRIWG